MAEKINKTQKGKQKTKQKEKKKKIGRYMGLFGIKNFLSLVSHTLIFGSLFGFELKFWFNFGSL